MDVRAITLDVLERHDIADKGVLTSLVMAKIPEERSREALHQVIGTFVNYVISSSRVGPVTPTSHSSEPQLQTLPQRPGRQPIKSQAGKTSAWARFLRDRIETPTGTKLVKDCNAEDLRHAAKLRWDLATSNQIVAQRFEDLAKLVEDYNVAVLEDLPEDAWKHLDG